MVVSRTPELSQDLGPDLRTISTDRRAQVDPQSRRDYTFQGLESPNAPFHDSRDGSAPARMKQSKRTRIGIKKIYRHAIGRGHRQENTGSVRRQAVRLAGDTDAGDGRRIDDYYPGPVNLPTDDARAAAQCARHCFEPLRDSPGGSGARETIVLRGDRRSGDETGKLPFPACMNEQVDISNPRPRLPGQQGISMISISAPSARRRTSIRSYPRSICPML